MRRLQLGSASLVVFLGLAGSAAGQTVDNPQYHLWAAWREGASFTWKTESAVSGAVQTKVTSTQTLKKVTADKVVVEITGVTEVGGQTIKSPAIDMDIPAKGPKVDAAATEVAKDALKDMPKYKETKGRETLTISGKKLDCEWIQYEMEGGMSTKIWSCPDVPGQMVKSESKFPGGTSTAVLSEVKGTKK